MAIRAQDLPKKSLERTSICFMPHFTVNSSSWWSSNEIESSHSQSNSLTSVVVFQSSPFQEMKSVGLGLQSSDSHSTQSNIYSQQEVTAIRKAGSHDKCPSSGSVHDESYQRHKQAQITPNLFIINPEHPTNSSQSEMTHSDCHTPFGYSGPYFGGLYTTYRPNILPQMMGIAPARVPLPLDLAEDGPIYVNTKQYHGILRRRQIRAKLEAQNKLVKNRKPYLHESRHQHAVNRVRGCGGRFLSSKKLQGECNQNANTSLSSSPSSAFLSVGQDAHNGASFQQLHDPIVR